MKYLKFLTLFFFFLFQGGNSLQGQSTTISWGEFEPIKKHFYGKEIVYENGKNVFILDKEDNNIDLLFFQVARNPSLHLSVYDGATFTLLQQNLLLFPQKKKQDYEYSFMKILEVNGELFLFIKAKNEKTEELKLLVQKLDKLGKQTGPFLELETAASEKVGLLFSKTNTGDFDVITSPDKKHFASIKINPFQEDSLRVFYLKLFNSNLNVLWSGKVELPYKEEFYQLTKYRLSNEANLMFLGKRYFTQEKVGIGGNTKTKIRKSDEGKPNYNYNFFVLNTADDHSASYDLDLSHRFITQIDFEESFCSDTLIFSGFYSDKNENHVNGTFNIQINHLSNEFVRSTTHEFSKEFIDLFDAEISLGDVLTRNSNQDFLKDFRLDDYIVRDDGTSILVAEKYFIQVSSNNLRDTYGYSRTTTSYTYNYNDILVVYFNKKGDVVWKAKVPKHQVSYNDGGPYSSYVMNANDSGMYFLFNDHKNNLDRLEEGDEVKNVNNFKRASTTLVTINNEGIMERKELFSAKEEGFVFRPKSSWYPRDIYRTNKIYLFGLDVGTFKRTSFKIGSLNFSQ